MVFASAQRTEEETYLCLDFIILYFERIRSSLGHVPSFYQK